MQTSGAIFVSPSSHLQGGQAAGLPLAALSGGRLGPKFHSWFGLNGTRYVCSVFDATDFAAMDAVRSYGEAVVLAVRRDSHGVKSLIGLGDTGHLPDLFWRGGAMAELLRDGVDEFHVHLMAETTVARQFVVQDLLGRARH